MVMEESYAELVRKSEKYKTDRTDRQKEASKERLLRVSKKKIQTTMIGALSSVEKHLGFLWGHESSEPLTPEQKHLKEVYELVRSEILDRGNNQARNLETEFSSYDIKWLKYQLNLPVKPMNTGEEGNGEE